MGRGKTLALHTRAKIREKRRQGASVADLMRLFAVSRRTVQRCCNEVEKAPKRAGRPPSLSRSDCRKIVAQTRKTPTKPATQIADLVGVSITSRTIQRFLKKKEFASVRIPKAPRLTQAAQLKRLKFARKHLSNHVNIWPRVIFSDEKKWNLSGNDGYVRIWKEKTQNYTFESDLRRKPGIMVWGAISSNGAAYIVRLKGKITALSYQKMLEEIIFHEANQILPADFIFQQDNAPVHVAGSSINFFKEREIPLLEWPPYSPDLNIIENLWGIVSKRVYSDGKEYLTPDELWESVSDEFVAISTETIKKLFESIPRRLVSCLELKGKRTKY